MIYKENILYLRVKNRNYTFCFLLTLVINFFTFNILFADKLVENNFRMDSLDIKIDYAEEENQSIEKIQHFPKKSTRLGLQENKGQMIDFNCKPTPYVLFKAEAPNLNIWVTTTGLTYQFFKIEEEYEGVKGTKKTLDLKEHEEMMSGEWHRVDMVLKNATIKKENIIREDDITQGAENYYLGHCPNGIFNVKTYTKITIKEIYQGIDWVLYTANGGLKHDFIVHPNADPKQIKLLYEGSGEFEVSDNQIHFKNEIGEVTEGKLFCYQDAESNEVKAQYNVSINKRLQHVGAGNIINTNELSETGIPKQETKNEKAFSYELDFDIGNYDTNAKLIIDPELVWATFYGGNDIDIPNCIDVDKNDNVYIAGYTSVFSNFPIQNNTGTYNQSIFGGGYTDAFVLKFTNTGVLLWSTYYGGNGNDACYDLSIDSNNNLYLTGRTRSSNFPLQNLPTAYNQSTSSGTATSDCFILKFNSLGVRIWATYYGGSGSDDGTSIAIDNSDNVFITGTTDTEGGFPLQNLAGAYNQMVYGGSVKDFFIAKFSNAGSIIWSTYFGGNNIELYSTLKVDSQGDLFITGYTSSTNLPLYNVPGGYIQSYGGGSSDAFIICFTNTGTLLWGTYYGGDESDMATAIDIDGNNNLFIIGQTNSLNFSLQNLTGAYNQSVFGGVEDGFILKFTLSGVRLWSSYYGGNDSEVSNWGRNISIDKCNNVYLSFSSASTNMNTVNVSGCGYYQNTYGGTAVGTLNTYDVFLVKLNNSGAILWATYFGGDGADFGNSTTLDNNNNLFIVGQTDTYAGVLTDASYPLVNNSTPQAYYDNTFNSEGDCYIAKFNSLVKHEVEITNPTSCSLCNGSATVHANCGEAPFNYLLSNGQSVLNSPIPEVIFSNLCLGAYQVTVTSAACGSEVYSFSLTIADVELPYVDAIAINPMCPNANGSMIINSVSNITDTGLMPISNYTISEGANIIAINQTTPFTLNSISIGTHTYVVINEEGCSNTFTINISNSTSLSVDAGVGVSIPYGESANLLGTVPINTTYTWSPSTTLSCINCLNPTASPIVTTIYTLTVRDSNGCEIFDIVEIVVKERCSDAQIYLPNAFSPNKDGKNDGFCIQGDQDCISNVSLVIFNRWGNKVFESSDPTFCWDGTYNGKLLEPAVFVFYLKATLNNKVTIEKTGNVSLLL